MRLAFILFCCALGVSAAAREKSLIRNGDFENVDDHHYPRHWVSAQHAGERAYEFRSDAEVAHRGEHSMRIRRLQRQVWGITEQIIAGEALVGKTVEFKLAVRSEAVGRSGATVYVGAFVGDILLSREESEKIIGDHDWTEYQLRLEIPERTTRIRVGVSLDDAGTVWLDDASLLVVKPAAKS